MISRSQSSIHYGYKTWGFVRSRTPHGHVISQFMPQTQSQRVRDKVATWQERPGREQEENSGAPILRCRRGGGLFYRDLDDLRAGSRLEGDPSFTEYITF